MLNTAISLISDVVGKNEKNSAVVYGIYGFFDKVANGIIIFVITSYFNTQYEALRLIMGLIPIACSFLAVVLSVYGNRKYSEKLARMSIYGGS